MSVSQRTREASYTLFIIQYELGGAGGEEVAVVGGVHYLGVRAERVLGAVEEDVASIRIIFFIVRICN